MRDNVKLRVDKVKKSWKKNWANSGLRQYPISAINRVKFPPTKKIRGLFNGSNVVVHNYDHMIMVYNMGFFGKGSLSRSAPVYKKNKKLAEESKKVSVEVQNCEKDLYWSQQSKKWTKKEMTLREAFYRFLQRHGKLDEVQDMPSLGKRHDPSSKKDSAVLQSNSSGDQSSLLQPKGTKSVGRHGDPAEGSSCEGINRMDRVKSEISKNIDNSASRQKENSDEATGSQSECLELSMTSVVVSEEPRVPMKETLHLNLEEAYFLAYGLGCLQIIDLYGKDLTLLQTWSLFCQSQDDFIQKYVVYHYFRGKGWVVKPGLKFGGDFLLYKHGPPMTHATYLVIIEVVDNKGELKEDRSSSRSWIKYMHCNRVAENAGKDVLLCRVLWPNDVERNELLSPNVLKKFSVQENLITRWISSAEREKLDQEI